MVFSINLDSAARVGIAMAWTDRHRWLSDALDQGSVGSFGEKRTQRIICRSEKTGACILS